MRNLRLSQMNLLASGDSLRFRIGCIVLNFGWMALWFSRGLIKLMTKCISHIRKMV